MKRYRVSHQVNAGAFGAVFEAFKKNTGERVAIKKVNKKFYEFNQTQRNRELKALRALVHPNIVALLDFVEKGGSIHFVFEFMEHNLYEVMCNRDGVPFPITFIQSAVKQVLYGLEFMHKVGYFHCDLKPENILVDGDRVKIADLGQVQDLKKDGKRLTQQVTTRWYRAPEVLMGYCYYSSPIDIWAVGAIAAELMTLEPLFPGDSSLDQVDQLCTVLGSPSDISYGGSWPLGKQLAALSGLRFPRPVQGTLMTTLSVFPHPSRELAQFITQLLKFEPKNRLTATEALLHDFFYTFQNNPSVISSNCLSSNSTYSINHNDIEKQSNFFFESEAVVLEPNFQSTLEMQYPSRRSEQTDTIVSPKTTSTACSTQAAPSEIEFLKDTSTIASHLPPTNDNNFSNQEKFCEKNYLDESLNYLNYMFLPEPNSFLDSSTDTETIRNVEVPESNSKPKKEPLTSVPNQKKTIDSPNSQKSSGGLRRRPKIASSEFDSLQRLSGNFETLVRSKTLNLSKAKSFKTTLFDSPKDTLPSYTLLSRASSDRSKLSETTKIVSQPRKSIVFDKLPPSGTEFKALTQRKSFISGKPVLSNIPAPGPSRHSCIYPDQTKPCPTLHKNPEALRHKGSMRKMITKVTTLLKKSSQVINPRSNTKYASQAFFKSDKYPSGQQNTVL